MNPLKAPLVRSRDSYGSTQGTPTAMRRRYGGQRYSTGRGQPRGEYSLGDAPVGVPPNATAGIHLKPSGHPEEITGTTKLGTVAGVTMPTILNVLSILMFLRFGFVLGQMGILGTLLLLVLSYGIDLLTTLSVSAIATNGTVKGGGAYYMISRSLGVEFGGAIGIILYIGQILNAALNVAGLIEPLLYNFGTHAGVMAKLLPEDPSWQLLYSTALLGACTLVAFVGAGLVSRCGGVFTIVLLTATLSVPISALFVRAFQVPGLGVDYSGLSLETLVGNLWPHYTAGASGSQIPGVETFNDIFGIFFPATAGILAGSSLSEDLQNPSKAIPTGTLQGLLVTVVCYFLVICAMGASIPRQLLYRDVQVMQTVSGAPVLVILGEIATALFSVIVGLVGAAQLLQALGRDEIFPGTRSRKKKTSSDSGWQALAVTWLLSQLCLFADVNQLATMITMAFLMTFIAINVACALLKLGSAPNFRPSFRYFTAYTAIAGSAASVLAMFIVDGLSACLIITFLAFLIVLIHYISPPKQWGDVSQSLIYHQVRKYLLKLRQDNVKYWRPQILLLVDNPRTTWRLICFCNHLKKGGLYILGHVVVSRRFQHRVGELNKQRSALEKVRDLSRIKAFVQISIAPTFSWGVRNVFLGSGLGGMKPNITILAFYDLSSYSREQLHLPSGLKFENRTDQYANQVTVGMERLPTDACPLEPKVKLTEWVGALEDLSLLNSNVAVAKGFPRLLIPNEEEPSVSEDAKKFIDLYPIQMASKVTDKTGDKNILTTNFDTYTLILQLGAILHTVPSWHKTHKVRVVVFVEYEGDVADETERVRSLLEILRIEAQVVVKCLDSGELETYEYIAKGRGSTDSAVAHMVDEAMGEDKWWRAFREYREEVEIEAAEAAETAEAIQEEDEGDEADEEMEEGNTPHTVSNATPIRHIRTQSRLPPAPESSVSVNPRAIRKLEQTPRDRYSFSKLSNLGVSLSMVASKLPAFAIHRMEEETPDDDWAYSRSTSDTESVMSYASSSVSALPSPYMLPKNATATADHVPHLSISSQNSSTALNSSGGYKSPTLVASDGASSVASSRKRGAARHMRKPRFDSLKSNHSLRNERSLMVFSAETMPTSHVLEDAQGNEPSIVFVKDKPKKRNGKEEGEEEKEGRNVVTGIKAKNESIPGSEAVESDDSSITSCASLSKVSSESSSSSLSFNELPNRCQFLILNELMRKTSKDSALIFSTLPVPEIGMHENEEDCIEYASNLELWCNGLPPILLINAKTMTVTTNL
ncbi:DEKNAAC103487 [Brettanomyces naardenensis]|uniref:DEKNAAC103487 n=1 Tax=Brettanomyces naardenensis TaxID=13370 RepID=A0A448YNR5_BRENA|nr:DEKNAAC103487 [Brettanomyces naardenensis]